MDPIIGLVTALATVWLASIEVRMRNTDSKLRDTPSRREVSEEIEVRLEPVKVLHREIKEDIRDVKRAIEKLANK